MARVVLCTREGGMSDQILEEGQQRSQDRDAAHEERKTQGQIAQAGDRHRAVEGATQGSEGPEARSNEELARSARRWWRRGRRVHGRVREAVRRPWQGLESLRRDLGIADDAPSVRTAAHAIERIVDQRDAVLDELAAQDVELPILGVRGDVRDVLVDGRKLATFVRL